MPEELEKYASAFEAWAMLLKTNERLGVLKLNMDEKILLLWELIKNGDNPVFQDSYVNTLWTDASLMIAACEELMIKCEIFKRSR